MYLYVHIYTSKAPSTHKKCVKMYVYVYMYMHTHKQIHMYIYVSICTHIHLEGAKHSQAA